MTEFSAINRASVFHLKRQEPLWKRKSNDCKYYRPGKISAKQHLSRFDKSVVLMSTLKLCLCA